MTEYHFEINGSTYRVKVKEARTGHAVVEVNGTEYQVAIKTPAAEPSQSVPMAEPMPLPVAQKSASAGVEVPGRGFL